MGTELAEILTSALPIYTRRFWPLHDRANREWIATTVGHVREIAPDVIGRLEKLYGVKWFTTPVRVDVVWVGNRSGGYTSDRPQPHVIISSGDANNTGWSGVEIIFHEASHVLIVPIHKRLSNTLGDGARDHRDLWHVVQFYLTGAVVREVLHARGIPYLPYMYSSGLFDRAWSRYRSPVESNWQPYVEGKASLDEAITGTAKMLTTRPKR